QLGETVVEGTIVKWLKSEGDSVDRDEPLFEISTDKVDTEVPSPIAGTITEILVQEGETVEVGTQLAMIESGDGQAAAEAEPSEEAEEPKEEAQAREEKAEEPPQPQPESAPQSEQPAQPEQPAPAQPEQQQAQPAAAAARGPRSHILSPLVRRLADEHGIDLDRVQGSGTGGRITKKDIMAVVESGQPAAEAAAAEARPPLQAVPEEPRPAPAPQAAPAAAEEVRPISHIRKRIAENMVASLHQSARAWNAVEVNMERIAQLRNRAKDAFKREEGISLTYMPFLARAVSDALLAYPDVNARLNLEEGTATYRRSVNLGVAVAYDEGLIVPIVKGAEGMNVVGLARAINDVATRARSKKLTPDEVHGGTFSITNPGPFGSLISVPIMNPGETAILAFDTVQKRPVVIDDAIAIRHMVYLSLSWDHRMIDGATAAQFLARIKENLETWDFTSEVQAYLT
ncbi:MAG TPA: 2-oxoglutarate dehydrogenase, E2 component, dihydrolipoamide succinyltransferase, partial [Actinomycetota bacterium]